MSAADDDENVQWGPNPYPRENYGAAPPREPAKKPKRKRTDADGEDKARSVPSRLAEAYGRPVRA
jgi:hypothetical protein